MKKILSLTFVIGYIISLNAQDGFLKFITFDKDGVLFNVIPSSDKGYIFNIMEDTSDNIAPYRTVFIKTDDMGNIVNSYPQLDNHYYSIERQGNDYRTVGHSLQENNKMVISWFDTAFNIIKEQAFYFPDEKLFFSRIYSTYYSDTLMLVSGLRLSLDPVFPLFYPYVAKLNLKNGGFIHSNTKKATFANIFLDSKIVGDTTYVFQFNNLLNKFDSNLEFENLNTFVYNDQSQHFGEGEILMTKGNNLFINGRKINSSGKGNISIIKFNISKGSIDKNVQIDFSKFMARSGVYKGASYIDSNKIFFAGWDNLAVKPSTFFPNDSSHIVLAQVDSSLNLKWQKQYGGDAYYMVYGVEALEDGGCIVYGSRYQPGGELKRQGFLLKVNEKGEITSTSEPAIKEIVEFQPFPNPASEELTWQLPPSVFKENIKLELYNSVGQLVKIAQLPSSETLKIEVKDLPSGVYLWRIADTRHEAKGKVVIVK